LNHIKKTKILILAVAGIAIIGLVTIVFGDIGKYFNQKMIGSSNIQNHAGQILLTIDFGNGQIESFNTDFSEGLTAFDLLKNKVDELNVSLETSNSEFGVFIKKIGGVKNGEDGKYWLYYVNEKMPDVAADKIILKAGDKVGFKFEKSPF
jgi:hypothetical protein